MSTDEREPWEGWAIVELMGHRRLAGLVSRVEVAGVGMIRLDVPEGPDCPAATQYYSPSSLYCLTPTTEEIARGLATHNRPAPVTRYELSPPPPIPVPARAPRKSDDDFDEDERYYDRDDDEDDDDL